MKKRLKAIASLRLPDQTIQTPCTYLQASQDRLISQKAALPFYKLCPNIQVKKLKGGHFIAQSNPEQCLDAMSQELGLR